MGLDKLKNVFSRVNIPLVGFLAYLLQTSINGHSVASSVAAFAIAGLYSFDRWLAHNKKPSVEEQIESRIGSLEKDSAKQINALKDKVEQLENHVSSIKLSQGIRVNVEERKKHY